MVQGVLWGIEGDLQLDANFMAVDNKKRVFKGLAWSSIERFAAQGVNFVFTFIIARQLQPSDYGLIAMLGIFMALAQTFIDSGFLNALVQKQDRTEVDYSTVFYFNIVVAILIYLLLISLSDKIASFYNQPLLTDLIIWVSINFVISSFATVQRAILTINLDFKRQAWISLSSVFISGAVAVFMAYKEYGVYTLVFQGIIKNLINVLLLWFSSSWRPSLVFSIQSFRGLFGFSSKILLGGFIANMYTNSYTLLIGKFFPASDLGLYNRAETISKFPAYNFTNILVRVFYPIECELQNDVEALQGKFYSFLRMTSFVVFPIMLGICAMAEPIVRLTLTDKWMDAVPFIQIMCVAYMWDPIMRMTVDLLNVKHRSDLTLRAEVIKKTIAFLILFLSLRGDLIVVCLGLLFYSFSDLLVVTYFTHKLLPKVSFKQEMLVLLPIFLKASIMGLSMYSLKWLGLDDLPLLLLSIPVGIIVYIGISLLTHTPESEFMVDKMRSVIYK